jgi:hypothetical protein
LTSEQKTNYCNAVDILKKRQFSSTNNMQYWNYDQFVQTHWDYKDSIHGTSLFLPWHRHFTHGFELALKSIDPTIIFPYWDWSLDSQNPSTADIFKSSYFGGNGNSKTHCVDNGISQFWNINIPTSRPSPNCLKRCFDFTTLYNPIACAATLNRATDYHQLRLGIEAGSHAAVHQQLGGHCGDMSTMYSPNDPVFFLHHAMVDKMWWKWQMGCSNFTYMYNGSYTDILLPWNISVHSTFLTTQPDYCYIYDNNTSDIPLKLKCPSTTNIKSSSTQLSTIKSSSTQLSTIKSSSTQLSNIKSSSTQLSTININPNPIHTSSDIVQQPILSKLINFFKSIIKYFLYQKLKLPISNTKWLIENNIDPDEVKSFESDILQALNEENNL